MTLIRLLAAKADPWMIRWFFMHEQKQIDYSDGACINGRGGLIMVSSSLGLSSRAAQRLARAMEQGSSRRLA